MKYITLLHFPKEASLNEVSFHVLPLVSCYSTYSYFINFHKEIYTFTL